MAYYPEFDDYYVQTLLNKYHFTLVDFADKAQDFGFTLKSFCETANPLIFCIFDELTSELIDKLLDFNISTCLLYAIQERIQENTDINAYCSSLSCLEVYEEFADDIKHELLAYDRLDELEEIKQVFEYYNC